MSTQDFVDHDREYRVARYMLLADDCVGVHTIGDTKLEITPRSFFEIRDALSASWVDANRLASYYRLTIPEEIRALTVSGGLLSSVIHRDQAELRGFVAPIADALS